MESIVTGVYQVTNMVNSFIVDSDTGVVLIDTGLPKKHGAIMDALGEIGRRIDDVVAIVLTHAHADHTGGVAALHSGSGAGVIASSIDAPVVRGDLPVPPPPILDFPVLRLVARLVPSPQPVEVTHTVDAGPVPLTEDMVAIATPGHTAGHMSLLLDREGGVMFVGDAAMSTKRGVIRGYMNRKNPTFDASLRSMAERDFEVACFGHSPAITERADAAFQEFVAGI